LTQAVGVCTILARQCHRLHGEIDMKHVQFVAAILLAAFAIVAHASSHREALAILNEPCADNTDTYAWV